MTINITLAIQIHPALPARPAEYSPEVPPHARRPPKQAGRQAREGWRRNEDAHQEHHRRLIRPAVQARPASFSFAGHYHPQHERIIARAIVEQFGDDVTQYPAKIRVEYETLQPQSCKILT